MGHVEVTAYSQLLSPRALLYVALEASQILISVSVQSNNSYNIQAKALLRLSLTSTAVTCH